MRTNDVGASVELLGDNVGDVAGMGADIFESFVGSIIAAMVIANEFDNTIAPDYVMMPILLGLIGYIASVIGVFSMSFLKNGSDPAAALRNTTFIGALLFWAGGYGAILVGDFFPMPSSPPPAGTSVLSAASRTMLRC